MANSVALASRQFRSVKSIPRWPVADANPNPDYSTLLPKAGETHHAEREKAELARRIARECLEVGNGQTETFIVDLNDRDECWRGENFFEHVSRAIEKHTNGGD